MASGYPHREIESEGELAELIAEGARVAALAEAAKQDLSLYKQRMTQLGEAVTALAPGTEREWLISGDSAVRLGIRRSMDADRFKEDYPPEEHPYFYKHKPDMTTASRLLPEEEVAQYVSEKRYPYFAPAEAVPSYTTDTTTSKEN